MRMMEGGTDLVRASGLNVDTKGEMPVIEFTRSGGGKGSLEVDMVILAPALVGRPDGDRLAGALSIDLDEHGFFAEGDGGPVSTSREGIYVIGGAQGPKSIEAATADAYAAVAEILAAGNEGSG